MMQAAAASVQTEWGEASTKEEEGDQEAVYLCSGKKREAVPPRVEELNRFVARAHTSSRRRSRSRGARKSRARGRSRGREGDEDASADAPREAPGAAAQRGKRAPASVRAAGMLSGTALVSELHKQNLGHMYVAPLDKTPRHRQSIVRYACRKSPVNSTTIPQRDLLT